MWRPFFVSADLMSSYRSGFCLTGALFNNFYKITRRIIAEIMAQEQLKEYAESSLLLSPLPPLPQMWE